MSDLLRQSVGANEVPKTQPQPARAEPAAIPTPIDADDHGSSSDSSASSAASVATIRPSSQEGQAPLSHWTNFFDQELFLEQRTETHTAKYHVYLSPPANAKKDPLFICHHGAGASGLSFALVAQEIRRSLPNAGILSLEARGHGSVVTDSSTGQAATEYSLGSLAGDALAMITLTAAHMGWAPLPACVLVGHSLGGAVVTAVVTDHFRAFGASLLGYCVIDVVEGDVADALAHLRSSLPARPSSFASVDDAVQWHLRSRMIRNARSVEASVPSLLLPSPAEDGRLVWRTDIFATRPWWDEWFKGMSRKFLTGRGAKMLILARTDRLDKELMIGQMQGKFQLVVLPESGHFVQEDMPEKTAQLLVEFFRRNDRSNIVLPPKVSDLIAQGKKV